MSPSEHCRAYPGDFMGLHANAKGPSIDAMILIAWNALFDGEMPGKEHFATSILHKIVRSHLGQTMHMDDVTRV
jgi:hypothetical protein